MKICIISNGFTGATLPLGQHFFLKGYSVSLYYFVNVGSKEMESLDFDYKIPSKVIISLSSDNNIYHYLDKKIKVNLIPLYKERLRLEKIRIGNIIHVINRFHVKKIAKKLIKDDYDEFNIVVHTEYEALLAKILIKSGKKVVISYHEVYNNLLDGGKLKKIVLDTINLKCKFVVHSQNIYKELSIGLLRNNLDNVDIIHFGLFESYCVYADDCIIPEIYFFTGSYYLYLGYIKPYKGLKYLYEAVIQCGDRLKKKVIVAGGGKDEYLDKMRGNKNFIVINRFIKNAELVSLIRNSEAVVCPYIAASQSGLVQTAMVFNKPVIATKVGAFTEIIRDQKNGILIEPCNATELANVLLKENYYNFMNENNTYLDESYKWDYIVSKYEEKFKYLNENS